MNTLIDKLERTHGLEKQEFIALLADISKTGSYLSQRAQVVREARLGKDVFLRGLIEFTNYCMNGCYYCGINKNNDKVERYRLSHEEILERCSIGYELGFRTFVLQGGEDPYFTDELIVAIVSDIRSGFPDCAITLSIGEKSKESYKKYLLAGANRYLLRHETSNHDHYRALHPQSMSLENRKRCLFDLKELGYQVGTGFMVGSPYQTCAHLAEDLLFIRELNPQMVGIGPFIPHSETPFRDFTAGSVELTLYLLGLLRLMLPNALIPATTALGTLDPQGREKGLRFGANVMMPNLSPISVRKKYDLYNGKICMNEEAAECIGCLTNRISNAGYNISKNKGDYKE